MQQECCISMNKLHHLINRIRTILRDKRGFSLTELLVATLIMVLATGALTSALTLAYRHFFLATQRTEAQLLCASIAEFVEDELAFSTIAEGTPADAPTWSNGSHNMRSGIKFLVQNEDGTYLPISDTTDTTYGVLVITGDNYKNADDTTKYFMIANEKADEVGAGKGYSLRAGMSLKWDSLKKWYVVKINVVNKNDNNILSDTEFTVRPAAVTQP